VNILMTVPAGARLEWRSSFGVNELTMRETPNGDRRMHALFEVNLTMDGDDAITGYYDGVVEEIEERITAKKLSPGALVTVSAAMDAMIEQAFPEVTVEREALIDEQKEVRRRRREWLVEQIESGSYAAIEMLKAEFGESVRINVEVLGAA
jgi:hypothetical protein